MSPSAGFPECGLLLYSLKMITHFLCIVWECGLYPLCSQVWGWIVSLCGFSISNCRRIWSTAVVTSGLCQLEHPVYCVSMGDWNTAYCCILRKGWLISCLLFEERSPTATSGSQSWLLVWPWWYMEINSENEFFEPLDLYRRCAWRKQLLPPHCKIRISDTSEHLRWPGLVTGLPLLSAIRFSTIIPSIIGPATICQSAWN